MNKKGFTLVEISIVLVIIGLLVGEILVGQSLIESAKINKAVKQIQQFDVAVQQFKMKFKGLPGDSDKFQYGGNNNGLIEEGLIACCGTTYTNEFKGENRNFWPMLQIAGFKIDGIVPQMDLLSVGVGGIPVRASGSGQNVPRFALGEQTGVVPYTVTALRTAGQRPFGSGTLAITVDMPAANYYFIANFDKMTSHGIASGGNANRNWTENISVASAAAIDQKMEMALCILVAC